MTLKVTSEQVKRIKEHARNTYPNECCGALVGFTSGDGEKEVKEVVQLPNSYEKEMAAALGIDENERGRRNRYVIDPRHLFETEKQARSKSMSIIGFYHSHPDHPAAPSRYDLHVASSGYSYVIVSVKQGQPGEITCWQTDEARERFESEGLMEI
ncbi:MAG: Mov34/MPN/PAD-1 family protein [Terriglobia bacterium]